MNISQHAQARFQQRGITFDVQELILRYGTPRRKGGGAVEYIMTQKTVKTLLKALEKAKKTALLLTDDEATVITGYPRTSRYLNK